MEKKERNILLTLAGLAVLLLGIFAATGATTDRHTGPREIWACSFDMVASQTNRDVCALDMPQAATIESAQLYCQAQAGGAIDVNLMEAGTTMLAAPLSFSTAGDPVFLTLTDTAAADEAQIDFRYTSAAGETGTDCILTLVWYRQ